MNRKQMIEEIAREAGCSKRLVRKKLFARAVELKKFRPEILFQEAFLDKGTDWYNLNSGKEWWRRNSFEVCFFPSGCVVLFRHIARLYGGELLQTDCGARLYSWRR